MPIGEYLRTHTRRQHLAWLAWLRMDLDRPSRADAYMMQVACQVTRGNAKNPRAVKLSDFVIDFGGRPKEAPKMSREQAAAVSKSLWIARVGGPGKVREVKR